MRVAGVDFTSAPNKKKPITVAVGEPASSILFVDDLKELADWLAFDAFLNLPPASHIGLDFPFSLPNAFLSLKSWSDDWEVLMGYLFHMGKSVYETEINIFTQQQAPKNKHLFRETDRITQSSSPMKLHYTPVGKMLFEGAIRLWRSNLAILPFRQPKPGNSAICVEAYPAMVAKYFGYRASQYKSDGKATDAMQAGRQAIIKGIQSAKCQEQYGYCVKLSDTVMRACLADATGDKLDAVLCALQAAWSLSQPNYGIPDLPCALEGWIVDPACLVSV